jgi:AsmA-like C-terminal region
MGSTAPQENPPEKRARFWPGLLKWVVVAIVCLWLADTGISLLIRHTTLKRRLTARLEAAFGRPVEVGNYDFSLWTGPELEADSVRVGEDPRFGYEYFLRADSMTLRVRLPSLLFGHLELGTISLSHPSLNLVRNANGDWNLAEWLPRPEDVGGSGANANREVRAKPPVPRVYKIEVNGGRINFKRGNEKLPFAFVDVNGTAETEGTGRWRLDLVAAPERAAVIVQNPGLLHLVGHLGGTSSRLRPAVLQIDWSDASIPDVLRLAEGNDRGVRGTMGVSVLAQTHGDSWTLAGHALLSQLHRWDLPLRADNPSVTVIAGGQLDPSGSRVGLTGVKMEMAHSSASITGALDWTQAANSGLRARGSRLQAVAMDAGQGTELQVVSNGISLPDLLEWARAFHPGISDEIAVGGVATLDANLRGWPPRLLDAKFDLARGGMIGMGMPSVRFGSVGFRYDAQGGIALRPATLTIGAPADSFRVEGSAKPAAGTFSLRVRGGVTDVRGVIAAAGKLGWNLARGWKIAGPASCDLLWDGFFAGHTGLSGSVEWGKPSEGLSLVAPFLNRPVDHIHAREEMKPSLTRVTLTARAFGTGWTGTLEHEPPDGWKFSLAGNSLSAAELDRWLDPRWRESFLDRMFPFLNSQAPASAALDSMRASGKIALEQFILVPVTVNRFGGEITIDGRRLQLTDASGQFGRGQIAGSLRANFDSTPRYETTVDFSGIDLQALSADFPSLAGGFAGTASAKIRFTMRGASRSELVNSLECRGTAVAKELSVANIGLPVLSGTPAPSETLSQVPSELNDPGLFPTASAAFSCAGGNITFLDLRLTGTPTVWNGTGSVDFARNLDLQLRSASSDRTRPPPARLTGRYANAEGIDAAEAEYRITGTLAAPRVLRSPVARRAPAENR